MEISGAKVKVEDIPGCWLGSVAFMLQISCDEGGSVYVVDLIELPPQEV